MENWELIDKVVDDIITANQDNITGELSYSDDIDTKYQRDFFNAYFQAGNSYGNYTDDFNVQYNNFLKDLVVELEKKYRIKY